MILKNFPNLQENINQHIEDVQQTPSKINTKRFKSSQILVKILKAKDKEENLKTARGGKKRHHFRGNINKTNS